MTRASVPALLLGVALALGPGWAATQAAAAEPPTLTPEQIAVLCGLLDEQVVPTHFDTATIERYRAECTELTRDPETTEPSPPTPTPTPTPEPTPTPVAPTESAAPPPPTERTAPEDRESENMHPPVPAHAEVPAPRTPDTPVPIDPTVPDVAGTGPEHDERDPDEDIAAAPVAQIFDLPPLDYAGLLVPEAAPVPAATSGPAPDPASPQEADLAAAGSAVPLALDQDRIPLAGLLAAGLVWLTGVGFIRAYLARGS